MPIAQIILWILSGFGLANLGSGFKASDFVVAEPLAASPTATAAQPQQVVQKIEVPRARTGEIVKDLVNQPISMIATAFIVFGSVYLLAQVRAAGHEAAAGVRSATDSIAAASNPDTSLTKVRTSTYKKAVKKR